MLTSISKKAFNDNGYAIYERDQLISFSGAKKPVGVFIFILLILIGTLPFTLIYLHLAYSLFIVFLALFPAYTIIKGTEVPDTITINKTTETVELISVSGTKSKRVNFKNIKEIGIRSLDETHDANAFSEGTSQTIYYLCLILPGRSIDTFKFLESTFDEIKSIKKDIEGLIFTSS